MFIYLTDYSRELSKYRIFYRKAKLSDVTINRFIIRLYADLVFLI